MIRRFGELTLRQRGDVYDVLLGGVVLLSSAALETELEFGRLAPPDAKRVLVGGLGFGATARGVLEVSSARVLVAEKVPGIEEILRGELAHLAQGILDRVEIVRDDVADVIARERDLDAILLDVDNGPEWASFRTNARLYSPAGLAAAKAALSERGIYAVWSGYAKDAFVGALARAGFVPETVPLREKGVVRARAYIGRRRS